MGFPKKKGFKGDKAKSNKFGKSGQGKRSNEAPMRSKPVAADDEDRWKKVCSMLNNNNTPTCTFNWLIF